VIREGIRGAGQQQNHIFNYLWPEERVRKDHPLRTIRVTVDEVLKQLSQRFDAMYAKVASVDSGGTTAAGAVAAHAYSIRSERSTSRPALPLMVA
jgi:hypothetical protein